MDSILMFISIGLGFSVACMIFGVILYRSNDLGNSESSASSYTGGIHYDVFRDGLKRGSGTDIDEVDNFAVSYVTDEEINQYDPMSDKPVVQPVSDS